MIATMARSQRSPFNRIVLGHLVGEWRNIALGVVCIVGVTLMTLAAPWPMKFIFDQILLAKPLPAGWGWLAGLFEGGSVAALVVLALTLVAIALVTGFFSYYQQFLTSRIGYQIVYLLRGELFDHLQRLSLSFHNRARTGELMSKITADTNTLRDVYAESALVFSTQVFSVAGMLVVLMMIDWKLGLITMGSFPVLFGVLFVVLKRVKKSARKQRSNEGMLASRVGEMLSAVYLVQAFGRERFERERFDEESAQSMAESIRTVRMEAAATRLVEVVTAVGTAIVVLFGGMQALRGRVTPGDLLVFVSYVTTMYKPVKNMARLSARMSKASVSAERINQILEIEPEIRDAPDAIEARGLKGEIRFEHVSFGYEPGKLILDDVSFYIPKGKRVALVGSSGAGKSTIANLILRLYDANSGTVLIDGTDVRRYQRESLRREVGVVLQDTILFGTTIRENISYGKPEATDEEIENAARQVHAHDFISRLPDGYDEVLGEGGATISGGQRQRICLARALVKHPSILIMDEPTSAVDADSEALIRDAVRRVQEGKTMLLVAHQLYSVQDADLILVLKGGKIVEQGTHQELASRGGYYCELFRLDGAPEARVA
jgi:ABC-type multidrug transport system fused ATPase/permease subunit